MKALMFTANPAHLKEKHVSKKRRKARGTSENPSKHHKKSRISLNPFKLLSGSSAKGVTRDAMSAGKLVAGGVINKLVQKLTFGFLPAQLRGDLSILPKIALAEILGWGLGKAPISFVKKLAEPTKDAGVFLAGWELLAPKALSLIPASMGGSLADGMSDGMGELSPGSRFHLIQDGGSLGETVVRDPLPTPSYLGETYQRDRDGLSGQAIADNGPNRLQAAWEGSSSVYDN